MRSIARLIPGVRAGRIITAYRHIKDALKVSENIWGLPKLITTQSISLEGVEYKVLERNHRDKLSAKYLYENYLKNRSFVSDNNRNQWIALGQEISIPFGYSDFISLLNSNFMKNQNGDIVRIESVKWIMSEDRALVQYKQRTPYDTRLIEEFIEPGK